MTRGVPAGSLAWLWVFVWSHLPRCTPLDTQYYYYVLNGKLTYHPEPVVSPLTGYILYTRFFSMFNISNKGREFEKVASNRKASWHTICGLTSASASNYQFSILIFRHFIQSFILFVYFYFLKLLEPTCHIFILFLLMLQNLCFMNSYLI